MDTGGVRHVLAHVIHADIHQFAGIKSAPAKMRGGGGMRCLSGEGEINPCVCKRVSMLDRVESGGMPGYGGADIIEQAVARHIGLRRTTFLSGAAIVADTRLDPGVRKPVLDGGCGKQRRRTQQIMPAPMAITTVGYRSVFSNTRFLAQAGKGIKFTQDGDDGAFVSGFADDRCRHAADILRDPETLSLKRGDMLLYRLKFLVERFRRIKDPVCQFNEGLFLGVHKVPDGFFILNAHVGP